MWMDREYIEENSIPEPNTGCWLWTGSLTPRGYGNNSAHRHSYEAHKGAIPNGLVIRHKCDQPSCVNPDHLEIGTHQDNVDDKMRRGRYRVIRNLGEAHGHAKLTAADIIAIRSSTDTWKTISDRYGVCVSHIGKIKARKAWGHV